MRTEECPTCGGSISIYFDNEPGDVVICEDCEQSFDILSISPMILEPIGPYDGYGDDDYESDYDY